MDKLIKDINIFSIRNSLNENSQEKISRRRERKRLKRLKKQLKKKKQTFVLKRCFFHLRAKKCFYDEVRGWHFLNKQPINEKIWEIVNSNIFKKLGCKEMTTADGSHKPGMDIACNYGKFSNKTSKFKYGKYDISSYRLTKCCSDNNYGNILNICQEINNRCNFDKYAILGRKDSGNYITYKWFLVPSKDDIVNPCKYDWSHKIGKQGPKTGDIIGWVTNKQKNCWMDITFSMSSQLWLHIDEKCLEEFLYAEIKINLKDRPEISYSDIYNIYKNKN